ncbi:ribonuclease HII [Candidatus Saccharibacteria bacterium]|nr:ribonuclease HII [Candidatus Saccharibacteria bacterium]
MPTKPTQKIILGIDEVGRGPWAGPLVIGAVILPKNPPAWVEKLTDSKKLTPKKREELAPLILKESTSATLGWVSARELDTIGLSSALKLATRRAVRQIHDAPFTEIIIDGTSNFLSGTPLENRVTILKKADLLIKEVSAASIIAKVARDHYMVALAEVYPGYGFENHLGYGTAAHRQALETLGPTPEHRTSFKPIQNLLKNTQPSEPSQPSQLAQSTQSSPKKSPLPPNTVVKNTTKTGAKAESVVADYLESQGHYIITRNHKTKFYEIDIISAHKDKIYFTEVKYRKTPLHGTPLEAITPSKKQQMTFAAESFLKYTKPSMSPILAAAAVSGPDFHLETWFPLDE